MKSAKIMETNSRGRVSTNEMSRKRNPENDLVVSAGASAAPSRRKPARTRAKHSAVPAEVAAAEPDSTVVPEAPVVPESTFVSESTVSPSLEGAIVYEPTHEEISALAYALWEARGCQGGSPEEDWLRAEAQLRNRAGAAIA